MNRNKTTRRFAPLALLGGALLLATPGWAQDDSGKRPAFHLNIGPDAGVYLPTNKRTRDRFSSTWAHIGFGFGGLNKADKKHPLNFDFGFIQNGHRGDKRALLVPIGVSYRQQVSLGTKLVPYVGVSGNLIIVNFRSDEDGLQPSTRTTGGGSAILGTTLGENFFVEARYYLMGKVRTYDFSGINISAGIRF